MGGGGGAVNRELSAHSVVYSEYFEAELHMCSPLCFKLYTGPAKSNPEHHVVPVYWHQRAVWKNYVEELVCGLLLFDFVCPCEVLKTASDDFEFALQ